MNGHNTVGRRDWAIQQGPLETPCWLWQGTINTEGYGVLRTNYKQIKAHRWVWEQVIGPCPDDGTVPDHLCRTPACVNPDHLDWTSQGENRRRGAGMRLTTEQVRWVRKAATAGVSYAEIAATLGVRPPYVGRIVRREIWDVA